eukprot:NODE_12835_length_1200_cov_12.154706.p1 GENE.NODE_12835_length_1200_cov_12.154706~~NODE_12835_length_1200_cov_12.154706.p1  ORF type:complete len:229 (+),score=24.91 NODE_12835_length_1200_cov_12.154706:108-794(+)
MPVVRLNIGGTVFSIDEDSLASHPDSMLGAMSAPTNLCQPAGKNEDGAFIIERSPKMFDVVVRYLHQEPLELEDLSSAGLRKLVIEVDFYQLLDLKTVIQHEVNCRHQAEQQQARRISALEQQKRALEQSIEDLECALEQEGIHRKEGLLFFSITAEVGDGVRLNPKESYVLYNDDIPYMGTITSVTEDRGTWIGVRWDNGSVSHYYDCGKKGNHALVWSMYGSWFEV